MNISKVVKQLLPKYTPDGHTNVIQLSLELEVTRNWATELELELPQNWPGMVVTGIEIGSNSG